MFVAYKIIFCTLKCPSLKAKIGKMKKSKFGRIDIRTAQKMLKNDNRRICTLRHKVDEIDAWGQFHHYSTCSFYIGKLRTQLFCAYIFGLYFTGAKAAHRRLMKLTLDLNSPVNGKILGNVWDGSTIFFYLLCWRKSKRFKMMFQKELIFFSSKIIFFKKDDFL